MPWIATQTFGNLVAALSADIVREVTAADHYLRMARSVEQLPNPSIRHQIAICASTAMSNASALAAELMALGGIPPSSSVPERSSPRAANSLAEHLIDARADLAHYRGRLALAKRLGLLRLQEVLREIVLCKRRHLAHAGVIAPAWAMRRSANAKRDAPMAP